MFYADNYSGWLSLIFCYDNAWKIKLIKSLLFQRYQGHHSGDPVTANHSAADGPKRPSLSHEWYQKLPKGSSWGKITNQSSDHLSVAGI